MGRVPQARLRRLIGGAIAGTVVGIVCAIVALERPDFLERAESATYDLRVRAVASSAMSSDIIFIDVGEGDIRDAEKNWGVTWPWPRAIWGYITKYAHDGGAKVIIFDWVFLDRGVYSVEDAEEFAAAVSEAGNVVIGLSLHRGEMAPESGGEWGMLAREFDKRADAEALALRLLAWDVRSFVVGDGPAKVFVGGLLSADAAMAMWDRISGQDELLEPLGIDRDNPPPPPEPQKLTAETRAAPFSIRSIIARRDGFDPKELSASFRDYPGMDVPLAVIAVAPQRMGVVTQLRERDGVVRRSSPFYKHDGKVYPGLSMAALLVGEPDLNPTATEDILELGDRSMKLSDEGRFYIKFDHAGRFKHLGAYSVLRSSVQLEEGEQPEISPSVFKDKYVIVSARASGLRDAHSSPVAADHPGAEIQANVLENLISGSAIRRAGGGLDAAMVLVCSVVSALIVMLAWGAIRRVLLALVVTFGVGVGLGLVYWQFATFMLDSRSLWISAVYPLFGIGASAFAAVLTASASERRSKRFVQEALGRYTSPALVAELTEHPEHLSLEWGEVRQMSVYFSDIAGFTTISEGLEPQKLVALLNEYLTSMTDIILAHDGVVDKYIGDAIMAFWGAPIPDPDHAVKAVKCALAMRKKCEELRPEWQKRYGEHVFARAGVNSGEAVVGNMGSAHKYNYTVMGDMVNLAARLEGANKPYGSELMISEYTLEMLGDEIAVRELDLLAVKGKEEPVRVYEVLDLAGEVAGETSAVMAAFDAGLSKYREQKFADALAEFEKALELDPEDGPSKLFAERCRHFASEPPADDWDGVWRMKTK